ncbi:hypothetical protein D0T56_10145 [Dysgonomonas sp. 520]|nr:hypothetical protein [Dysgonomonas sp. 520]
MNTNDPYTQKNNNGEFVYEGDSLDVYYRFNGENAPISVGVRNKTSHPIYVDWRESGITLDGEFSPYLPPYQVREGQEHDRLVTDMEGIAKIFPGERIDRVLLELSNFNFHKIKSRKYKHSYKDGNGEEYPVAKFTENDTPIHLFTYLTVYLKADDMQQPLAFESDFYLEGMYKAKNRSPEKIVGYSKKRGDMFYVRKETGHKFWGGVGKGLEILGGTILVVGAVALEVALDSGDD